MENPQIELARRYVEQTGVSVFLTGKAGTGKTTFLHEVAARCAKRHAIVAPTGVAAINAGGVTIHSFFQLPFDPYLPDVKELVTEYQLPDRFKSLSRNRINILRTLELLIIDEISMVRADLLDAIDMTLRRYRRNNRPFGGVQLLMIGDVHQLAPVVTEHERPFMEKVYPTPYFFASKALQKMPYVTIELTTVYRQQDATFVNLLNRVRDNKIDAETLRVLNSRVGTMQKDAITLTTHNRQANAINNRHMAELHGEERTFEAWLTGNFPDKALPCDRTLVIKVGERVMFLKNDSSGGHRYYNGKLATVTGFLHDEENSIQVIDDDGNTIAVGREKWESMKYTLNPENNEITQEVEGTFSQYPLQAAWAVTIHKAQGLTFDRVIIDAADAFAFGQVYVALSRCRTLEGLSLSTPLSAHVAFDDISVSQFVATQPTFEQTTKAAVAYEQQYRIERLMELFGVEELVRQTERLKEQYEKLKSIYPNQLSALANYLSELIDLQNVSERFRNQLIRLDESAQNERALKGADYFFIQLSSFFAHLPSLIEVEIDNKETAKHVKENGRELLELLETKMACLDAVKRNGYCVQTVLKAKVERIIHGEKSNEKKFREETSKVELKGMYKTQERPGDVDESLAEHLRSWRALKAKEEKLPVYMVLQQKALQSIASNKPQTPQALKRQLGVGPKTVEKYGNEILEIVAEFLTEA